jgi:riboflavin synthase
MFTGIVEEIGTVIRAGDRLEVRSSKVAADSGPGSSVAVGGVCLTVMDRLPDGPDAWTMAFDVSDETLRRTSLGATTAGDGVNLERPVTLLARLGGHLVQGHVDAVGKVVDVRSAEVGCEMTFELPEGLSRYVVEKGSVAIDGVSLTVSKAAPPLFGVALIPFTLEATTLGRRRVGDAVNVEVDVVAKYVEGLVIGR